MMETSLEITLHANRDGMDLKPIGNPEEWITLEKWQFQQILKQIAISTKDRVATE